MADTSPPSEHKLKPPGPVRVLCLTNHSDPVELPEVGAGGRGYAISAQRIAALEAGDLNADAFDVLVVDWAGRLAPEAVAALRSRISGKPALVVGDGAQAAMEQLLVDAGASEWVARGELTPYWMERTLCRLYAAADAVSEADALTRARRVDVGHLVDDPPLGPTTDADGYTAGDIRQAVFADFTERKRLLEQLAASEARFSAFMENLPALAYMKDLDGAYIYRNRAAMEASHLVADPASKHFDSEIFPNLDVSALRANDHQVLETGVAGQFHEVIEQGNGLHHMLSAKFPMYTPTGGHCLGGVSLDITELERIREALAVSEERLRLAIRGGVLGVWEWDAGDSIVMSQRMYEYLGLEAEGDETAVPIDLIGQRLDPADAEAVYATLVALVAKRDGEFRKAVRVRSSGLEERWIELVGHMHTDLRGPRLLGVAMDVTETRRAEEVIRGAQTQLEIEVKLRTHELGVANERLQREVEERHQAEIQLEEIRRLLSRSQESERMRLAHELHDGPMQELATIGFELGRTCRRLGEVPAAVELSAIRQRLQEVNLFLRSLAGDLRPPLLDTFGLVAAISGLIEQAQMRSPDLLVTALLPDEEIDLDDDASLAIYRICQQAIHNIQRHANATAVRVQLGFTAAQVEMQVKDDGEGFETPKAWVELARAGHLGIVGMEERARAMGGAFSVESAPGKGTTLCASVPRHGAAPRLAQQAEAGESFSTSA